MLISTSNDVIEVTNSDVDVTTNGVEIPTLRSTIRSSLKSTNASLSFKVSTEAVALTRSWNKTGSASD